MPRSRALKGTNLHPKDTGSFVPYLESFGKLSISSDTPMRSIDIRDYYIRYIRLLSDSLSYDVVAQAKAGFFRAFRIYAIRNNIKDCSKPRGYYISFPRSSRQNTNMNRTDCSTDSGCISELFVRKFIDKKVGFGIFALCDLPKGVKLVQYRGQWISIEDHSERERYYAAQGYPPVAVYDRITKQMLDANRDESGNMFSDGENLARYFNHSRLSPNCKLIAEVEDGVKKCYIITNNCIPANMELKWSYGDEDSESISANPWLLA